MIGRAPALAAALAIGGVPLLGAAPAAAPPLRADGTLVVQANLGGQPLNVGGRVVLYHKGALYRLDLVSLGIPGTSGDLSALATTLIGPGGASLLFDGTTGAMTAWSTTNRTYYVAAPPRPAAPPAARAAAAAAPNDPLATFAGLVASLHDVQSASLQLVGHTSVNGHPASDVSFELKRQLPGRSAEDYRARVELADDLGGFPLQISLQSVAAPGSSQGGAARLDLTQIQPGDQPDATFALPAGYTRVSTLAGILQAK